MLGCRHMKDHVDNLELLYRGVLGSNSDPLFFQNIHRYIDYIKKTPELSEIIDKSEYEYHKNHSNTWKGPANNENQLDIKEEETHRIERFSLYASNYVTLEVRIYWPIEYYKNPPEDLIGKYDPVAFLILKGFEGAKRIGKWNDKYLKTYNKWFTPEQKKLYETNLRQFHIDFLLELKRIKEPIKESVEEKGILFNKDTSVLKINGKEVKITLKNDKTNAHYVLEYIFDKGITEKSDYTDILEDKFFNEEVDHMSMYRACNDIQEKVRKQAGIENFLEIKSGKSGWVRINPAYA